MAPSVSHFRSNILKKFQSSDLVLICVLLTPFWFSCIMLFVMCYGRFFFIFKDKDEGEIV